MQALIRSMQSDHPGKPVLVVSNRPDAGGVRRAAALGVPTAIVDHRAYPNRAEFEAALHQKLQAYAPDILCLAGFMRILTPDFVRHWTGRCLNIHPSLLPKFRGLNTHARALEAGEDAHGCSVHEVTDDLDAGPILGQARLSIRADDTADTLSRRVVALEHRLYPAVLRRYVAGDRKPVVIDETLV